MNTHLSLPYGKQHLSLELPKECLHAVIESQLASYSPGKSQEQIVEEALAQPHGTASLKELAFGCKKVVIITSDHTRPMPSRITMPFLLEQIRLGNPQADITILVATGCHRATTKEELLERFGQEIVCREHIVVHDCDQGPFAFVGTSPSGNRIELNQLALDADLLLAEGFIEPHFFAGFSGGRKSILPGIASRATVMFNHSARNIQHPSSTAGILSSNPIHQDMVFAARASGIRFILNVILNEKKEIIGAVAGDVEMAHEAGVSFLSSLCRRSPKPSDIVITTNGGYPLAQNISQSVKGMTTAAATCRPGGVIIMAARCNDGHGGEEFYRTFASEPDTEKILKDILSRKEEETIPDQWQSQIFCDILLSHTVILVSEAPREMVEALHMVYSSSLKDALCQAKRILGQESPSVTVLPDGVSVIIA